MSDEAKDALGFAAAFIGIVVAIGIAVIVIGWVLGSIGNFFKSATEVTPEQRAAIEQSEKEWQTSPKNPKVAGQKCLDSGGFPKYSAWDGRFLECKGKGE